jgi:hypothetical protein
MKLWLFLILVAHASLLPAVTGDFAVGAKLGSNWAVKGGLDNEYMGGSGPHYASLAFTSDLRFMAFSFRPELGLSQRSYKHQWVTREYEEYQGTHDYFSPSGYYQYTNHFWSNRETSRTYHDSAWTVTKVELPLVLRIVLPIPVVQPNWFAGYRFVWPVHTSGHCPLSSELVSSLTDRNGNRSSYKDSDYYSNDQWPELTLEPTTGYTLGTGFDLFVFGHKVTIEGRLDLDDKPEKYRHISYLLGGNSTLRFNIGYAWQLWKIDNREQAAQKRNLDQLHAALKTLKIMKDEDLITEEQYRVREMEYLDRMKQMESLNSGAVSVPQ